MIGKRNIRLMGALVLLAAVAGPAAAQVGGAGQPDRVEQAPRRPDAGARLSQRIDTRLNTRVNSRVTGLDRSYRPPQTDTSVNVSAPTLTPMPDGG